MAALHFDGIYSNKMGRVAVLHHHLTRSAVTQSHVLPINSDLRRVLGKSYTSGLVQRTLLLTYRFE